MCGVVQLCVRLIPDSVERNRKMRVGGNLSQNTNEPVSHGNACFLLEHEEEGGNFHSEAIGMKV